MLTFSGLETSVGGTKNGGSGFGYMQSRVTCEADFIEALRIGKRRALRSAKAQILAPRRALSHSGYDARMSVIRVHVPRVLGLEWP